MDNRFENFTVTILKISKLIRKIKLFEMEEFDLKAVHVMCIYYAGSRKNGVTAAELCYLTSEDKAAISRALSLLTDKGYVICNEKKYNSAITLTGEGEKLFVAISQKAEAAVVAGGGFMTDEEREQFYKTLGKIAENLDQYYVQLNKR